MPTEFRLFTAVWVIAVSCLAGACAIESPVSITDRPLAEQLDEQRAAESLTAESPEVSEAEDVPQSLAFNEALESGDFVRLHVTNDAVPATLRSGPGSAYEAISDIPSGTEVFATGSRTGEWVHIMYADFDGWIADRRITFDPVDGTEQLVAADDVERQVTYVVVGEAIGVNLRAQPDASSDLVSGAPVGSLVTGSGNTEGTWIEVTYDGVTGWASGNYLEPATDGVGDASAATTTTTVAPTANPEE